MPATAAAAKEETAHRFAKDQLRAFIERVERSRKRRRRFRRHPGCLRRSQGRRLRRQGAAHHRAAAQAGCRERRNTRPCWRPTCTHSG